MNITITARASESHWGTLCKFCSYWCVPSNDLLHIRTSRVCFQRHGNDWLTFERRIFQILFCFCFSFRWTKDGKDFDPGTDSELKVSERSGSFAFYTLSNTMDSLTKYQGKYVCYASNELGTAVSNEAILNTDGKNVVTTYKPLVERA